MLHEHLPSASGSGTRSYSLSGRTDVVSLHHKHQNCALELPILHVQSQKCCQRSSRWHLQRNFGRSQSSFAANWLAILETLGPTPLLESEKVTAKTLLDTANALFFLHCLISVWVQFTHSLICLGVTIPDVAGVPEAIHLQRSLPGCLHCSCYHCWRRSSGVDLAFSSM